jgi:hypothetical protein
MTSGKLSTTRQKAGRLAASGWVALQSSADNASTEAQLNPSEWSFAGIGAVHEAPGQPATLHMDMEEISFGSTC